MIANRLFSARAASSVLLTVSLLLPSTSAHAGKDHCRNIEFDGVAGPESQDVVTFTVAEPDASVVTSSCPLQVGSSEEAVDFLRRLPASWGTSDGLVCPTIDLNDLPKKTCANSLGGTSCRLKLKLSPKSGPPFKKNHVEVCCYEEPDCKQNLGKISISATPVTIQAQKNAEPACPPDNQLPSGVVTCTVNLDPIGITQQPHPDLAKCRQDLGKAVKDYFLGSLTALVKCHRARNAAKISETTDCNSFAADPDTASTIAGLAEAVTSNALRCEDKGSPANFGYGTCPAPCDGIDIGGCTAGDVGMPCDADRDCDTTPGALDGRCGDWNQAAACLLCLGESTVTTAVEDKYGTPPAPLDGELARCQDSIGNLLAKLAGTRLNETAKCQKKKDGGKLSLNGVAACKDNDPSLKLQAEEQKTAAAVGASCSDPQVISLDSICSGATTAAAVGDCVVDNARALNDAYSFASFPETTPQPPGACPAAARIGIAAGTGAPCTTDGQCIPGTCAGGRCTTETSIDLGFTGLFHGNDVSDKSRLDLSLSCLAPEAPCGLCSVTGIDPASPNCRCAADLSVRCDEPLAADLDDCGGGSCVCFAEPPLPLSGAGTPVCVLNQIGSEPSGTIDVDTSQAAVSLSLLSRFHSGISLQNPCPVCSGDPVASDGLAQGSCSGGARNGLSCDTQAVHATFGPVSLDCPPHPGANVSGTGHLLKVDLTTGTTTLPFAVPCDPPVPPGSQCACAQCSVDPTVACATDNDCSVQGLGTCTASSGQPRRPNGCDDLVCTVDTEGEGQCAAGPVDSYCDGLTRADGSGLLTCSNDSDCVVFSAGNCTLTANRRCFGDPITAAGIVNPSSPVYVATTCVPPTASAAINGGAGLTGPARLRFRTLPLFPCSTDPNVLYQAEIGGCPP